MKVSHLILFSLLLGAGIFLFSLFPLKSKKEMTTRVEEKSEKIVENKGSWREPQWTLPEGETGGGGVKKEKGIEDPEEFTELFDWKGLTESEKNERVIIDWLVIYLKYDGEDREAMLEVTNLALRSRGIHAIPVISNLLETRPDMPSFAKAGLMEALGDIGQDIADIKRPEMVAARETIQIQLREELERPLFPSETPDLQSKIAAANALAKIADEEAADLLEKISTNESQDLGVQEVAKYLLSVIALED